MADPRARPDRRVRPDASFAPNLRVDQFVVNLATFLQAAAQARLECVTRFLKNTARRRIVRKHTGLKPDAVVRLKRVGRKCLQRIRDNASAPERLAEPIANACTVGMEFVFQYRPYSARGLTVDFEKAKAILKVMKCR